jgi:RNA polymerase sigma-70 factor (ECF subfamily)
MSDDQDLVTAVLARTPGAFERLVARHQNLVWHLVYRIVQHPEDARELCQDVFFRVHDRLHQYRFESALSTWIGRVAFSVATRHMQRKKLPMVEPSADGEDGSPAAWESVSDGFDLEAACADSEVMGLLEAAIGKLPAIQRTLVTLYHLEEMPVADIASVTGLPEGTVKNYLFRARSRLRQQLEVRMGVAA